MRLILKSYSNLVAHITGRVRQEEKFSSSSSVKYLHRCLPIERSRHQFLCPVRFYMSPVQDLSTVLQGHESNIHPMSHLQIYLRVSQMTIDVFAVKIKCLCNIASGT